TSKCAFLHWRLFMKKYRYQAILVVTVLVGVVMMYAIWRASPRTKQQFLLNGKTYYNEKKYSEAIIEFLNALQTDPRDREARYLLAQSYLSRKSLNEAATQLNALLEYYPDDQQASLQLGNIYLTGGPVDSAFFRQAKEIAERVLAKEP